MESSGIVDKIHKLKYHYIKAKYTSPTCLFLDADSYCELRNSLSNHYQIGEALGLQEYVGLKVYIVRSENNFIKVTE